MRDDSVKKRILYVLMFIVFFFMNFFTPFQGDDYTYAFNFVDKTPIRDLVDVVQSQYVHFHVANGRIIPHLFEQTFAGITGKWLFDIFNSFLMVFLISLVTNKLTKNDKLKSCSLLVVNAALFAVLYLSSFPGQSIFWMAGGLNYLLPTVLAIVIINLFRSDKKYNIFGLFLLAVISGWCQEAISLPVVASLFLLIFFYKEYRNRKNVSLLAGYIVGTLLIVLSPGTLSRLASGELHTQGAFFSMIVNKLLEANACLHELYIFWISAALIVFFLFTRKWEQFKKYKEWYILWVMNFLFFLALGFPQERITLFFSVICFLIVANYILPFIAMKGKQMQNVVIVLFAVLNCAGAYYALDSIYTYKQINDRLLNSVVASESDRVVQPIMEEPVPSRFIYPLGLNNGIHKGCNVSLAAYLGKKTVQFLKADLYEDVTEIMKPGFTDSICTSFTANQENITLYSANGLYYLKLNSKYLDEDVKGRATHVTDNGNLKWHQKTIRTILNSLDDGTSKLDVFLVFKSEDECYCFIPHIADREMAFELISQKDESLICSFERVNE